MTEWKRRGSVHGCCGENSVVDEDQDRFQLPLRQQLFPAHGFLQLPHTKPAPQFDKIASKLPGFRCEWNARRGAEELYNLFKRIEISTDTYQFRTFTRLKQLRYLTNTHQVDEEFVWR